MNLVQKFRNRLQAKKAKGRLDQMKKDSFEIKEGLEQIKEELELVQKEQNREDEISRLKCKLDDMMKDPRTQKELERLKQEEVERDNTRKIHAEQLRQELAAETNPVRKSWKTSFFRNRPVWCKQDHSRRNWKIRWMILSVYSSIKISTWAIAICFGIKRKHS